jgi:hypothetical protein
MFAMEVNHKIAVFKAVPSLMMQHQDSFGSRTRFLSVLTKQSWERLVLSSGFMTYVSVKSSTIMVIVVSSLWRSFGVTAKRSNKVNHSLASEAQHQNAHAEHAIQTIMYMARTFMVHASLHRTERGSDDLSLWPFAMKHLIRVYNSVPNVRWGQTPLELITREGSDYKDLLRCHVWGRLVFVLKAKH